MMKIYAYESRVDFTSEKRSETYMSYVDESIAGEKFAVDHKFLRSFWLSQRAGRNVA